MIKFTSSQPILSMSHTNPEKAETSHVDTLPTDNKYNEAYDNGDIERTITRTMDCDGSIDSDGNKKAAAGEVDDAFVFKDRMHDPTYFPEGGMQANMAMLGGFLAVFTTWGIITSFGVFQTYYKNVLLPELSSFQLGWIQSLQLSCIFMGGVFTGRPFDDGYFYHLEVFGSALIFVSFMLLAQCTELYQILLAQGVGMGLGMGVLFGPVLGCCSTYFKRRRGFAMCVCAAGGGVGGIIFPIAANNLLERVGFPWTIRILAFIELFCLAILIAVMRDKLPFHVRQMYAKKKYTTSIFSLSSWIDESALKSPEFMFFVAGATLCFFALYTPFTQLQSFALHINADPHISRYIVAILNAAGVLGRFSVFLIARWFGALNMTVVLTLLAAATTFPFFTISSDATLVVFALFYGYLSGVIGTFPPFCIPHLTEDITRLGTRFGMCFFVLSIFTAFSIPLSGLTLGPNNDNYMAVSMFCGASFVAASVLLAMGRISKAGFKLVII